MTPIPRGSSRSVVRDLEPGSLKTLTLPLLLARTREVWRTAKAAGATDLIAVVVEGSEFAKGNPPMLTATSEGSKAGLAAACVHLLGIVRKDDQRIDMAVELLAWVVQSERRKR